MKQLLFLLFASVLLAGCFSYRQSASTTASDSQDTPEDICNTICRSHLAAGFDLSKGPCLAQNISVSPDWVCDVAHSPRQPVDDLPENQCSQFGKTANHFVEVDPQCNFIKKY